MPVHPELQRLGFLQFVRSVQGASLWPDYADAAGSDRFSNMFSRRLARLGLKDEGLSFHSRRRTFTNALKQIRVPESVIAELVGHGNPSLKTGRYGKRYEPKVLLDVILKLDYGLDLSHLYGARG